MLDPYSYVTPSRVRTFLCPLGNIRRNTFLQYADRLNNAMEVRLVDVTPDPRPDRNMFSPLGYPNGKVVYDFSLSPIDEQLRSLYDLEPWRQTLVVLGLTTYKDNTGMDFEEQVKQMKARFPNVICHKVVVFGVPDQEMVKQTKNVLPVLSAKLSVTSLESALCDITSDFLAELAVLTISKQLGSLLSPAIKELDTPLAVSRPGDKAYNISLRRGMVRHNSSHSSVNLSRAGSIAKNESISIGPTERSRSKQRGRVLKYTGNMYLLAGRISDALQNFAEAADILRAAYDHLWFGSALDCIGVCVALQGFLEAPQNIPPVALRTTLGNKADASTSDLSLSTSNNAYSHTPSSSRTVNEVTSPSSGSLPLSPGKAKPSLGSPAQNLAEFLPELTISVVRFLARSQSSSEESVPQLVYCETMLRFVKLLVAMRLGGGITPAVWSHLVRGTSLSKHITSESPPASVITNWCNKIYATDLSNLPILMQSNVYSGIASAYSSIGLMRKRTFILRELLVNLVPKIIKSRRQKMQFEREQITPESQYSTLLDGVHEEGILELLLALVQVYGAGDLSAPGCGWSSLKISFLKTCISVCDSIPDIEGVVYYTSLILSTSADVLTPEEQVYHYRTILRALDASRHIGRGDVAATYWDPYLVRDIVVSPATSSLPVEQAPVKSEDMTGVFLYNPYNTQPLEAVDSSGRIIVQNERAEFVVKLQNPFAFEVQVGELSLLTEGVELEASATNIYLPPSSMYELVLPGVPKTTGELRILGCKVQMVGCRPTDFYLKDGDARVVVQDKIKAIGVYSGLRVRQLIDEESKRRELRVTVIPEQPRMAVKSLSLNRGWLMLLEGESHVFTLTLSNISDVLVNMMQFKFQDSTTEPLQQAMQNKELPLSEIFECEYFLYERQALSWANPEEGNVPPHHANSFSINVNGKRGMTGATMNIDYGHFDADSGSSLWSRRLAVPIDVTVSPSIELGGCDIIPLSACQGVKSLDSATTLAQFIKSMGDTPPSEYVVVIIDMRNSWNQPMKVNVWSKKTKDEKLHEMTEIVNPNRIKRFLLPIKWKSLTEEELNRPIPLKSRKQYVIESNMTQEQARFMREAFWNRERLLEEIDGTWEIADSNSSTKRNGSIEMRGLRLSQKMVNVLRLEQVRLEMKIQGSSVVALNDTTSQLECDEEDTVITVTIENRKSEMVSGILRIVPATRYDSLATEDDMSRRILYNGVLQQPVMNIPPGGVKEVKLGVVFVARGEYDWASLFEISTPGPDRLQQHGQRQHMYVKVV